MPRFKAHTTTVAGRQYRSQLEARWATLFGLLGWPFEYEPFQLRGWIPDFLLLGATPVLVEVKPVYTFPPCVAEKVELATPPHEVLILGCTLPATPKDRPGVCSPRVLGWLAERSGDGDHTHLWWGDALLGQTPGGDHGFRHREGSGFDRIGGDELSAGEPGAVAEMWADAGNRVQWGMR
jgi:hypothetical protein